MNRAEQRGAERSLRQWRERHQPFELRFHRGAGGDWRYGEMWERAIVGRKGVGSRCWKKRGRESLIDILGQDEIKSRESFRRSSAKPVSQVPFNGLHRDLKNSHL